MDRSRTKQVCTIGPASADKIADLVAAGMDVARINFSHGTPEEHKAYVHAVRAAAHSARRSVAVMIDLPGPKLRLGDLAGGEVRLETGAQFVLRADDAIGDANGAPVPRGNLGSQLEVGDRVLLADGAVELSVAAVEGADVHTGVVNGGLIRSRAGVNVPSERLAGDGLTDEDRDAVPRALELRADLIAQSFVRSGADVRALRSLLPADGPRVVAKIETSAAIDAFDDVMAEADGIMVARGDLGVDVPYEDVPLIQKDLVRRATAASRFTIVANQMLESMTGAPRPTRAEASDVANAVLDGADAVMLSAETAIGSYPVEALEVLARVCVAAETELRAPQPSSAGELSPAEAVVMAAAAIAARSAAGAVWCFTRTGRTAEMLSLQRPAVPIVAFTLSPIVARRLAARRGVVPVVLPGGGREGALIDRMEAAWRAQRAPDGYDSVILITTSSESSGINRLELHRLAGGAHIPGGAVRGS
ncbi:pyruvate kinase [soil metagenome]